MRKITVVMFFLLGTCLTALAENIVVDDELLKLDVPEMEPKLVTVENQTYRSELSLDIPTADISLTSDGSGSVTGGATIGSPS
jgi:hypothetical protein